MQPSTTLCGIALAVFAASASASAHAQEASPPSFDVLRAAHAADSLRTIVVRQRADLGRVERERRQMADVIRRQRERLDSLERRAAAVAVSPPVPAPVQVAGVPATIIAPRDTSPPSPGPAVIEQPLAVSSPAEPQPAASVPVPAPAAVPTPAPAAAATPAPAAAPSSPAQPGRTAVAGFGSIVLDGLLQVWLTGGDAGYRNSYRIRRAEVKLSGEVTSHARWTVMADFAKSLAVTTTSAVVQGQTVLTNIAPAQSSRLLQDALITLTYVPHVTIDVGQQKIPLGLEGQASSSALDAVERALFASDRSRGGSYGDIRDIGAVGRGALGAVDYQFGVFDGSGEGQNDVDHNTGKAGIGRLVLHPRFLHGLRLGGSGVYAAWNGTDQPRRDRLGGELSWRRGRLLLQSELMTGHDGVVPRRGFYSHAGVQVTPLVQVVARVDSWDPDTRQETSAANATERDYDVGANMQLAGNNVKLQLVVQRKTYTRSLVPARTLGLLNVQAAW